MYKEWYDMTPEGEKKLRQHLDENPEDIKGVRKRLSEVRKVRPERCALSARLAIFLERIDNDYR